MNSEQTFLEQSTMFFSLICTSIDKFEKVFLPTVQHVVIKSALSDMRQLLVNLQEGNVQIPQASSTPDPPKSSIPSKFKNDFVTTGEAQENKHDNECVICLEEILKSHAQAKLSCDHLFHLCCVGSTFNSSNYMRCPVCRTCQENAPDKWIRTNLVATDSPAINTPIDYAVSFNEFENNYLNTNNDSQNPYTLESDLFSNEYRRSYYRRGHSHRNASQSDTDNTEDSLDDSSYITEEPQFEDYLEEISNQLNQLDHEVGETIDGIQEEFQQDYSLDNTSYSSNYANDRRIQEMEAEYFDNVVSSETNFSSENRNNLRTRYSDDANSNHSDDNYETYESSQYQSSNNSLEGLPAFYEGSEQRSSGFYSENSASENYSQSDID